MNSSSIVERVIVIGVEIFFSSSAVWVIDVENYFLPSSFGNCN